VANQTRAVAAREVTARLAQERSFAFYFLCKQVALLARGATVFEAVEALLRTSHTVVLDQFKSFHTVYADADVSWITSATAS